MAERLKFARPIMRCSAGFDPDQARRYFLEERQDVTALQLAADDHLAFRVDDTIGETWSEAKEPNLKPKFVLVAVTFLALMSVTSASAATWEIEVFCFEKGQRAT